MTQLGNISEQESSLLTGTPQSALRVKRIACNHLINSDKQFLRQFSRQRNVYRLGNNVEEAVRECSFDPYDGFREVEIVFLTPRDMGFTDPVRRDELYATLYDFGIGTLRLCTHQEALQLRFQMPHQLPRTEIHVGTGPVKVVLDEDKRFIVQCIFCLSRSEEFYWVHVCNGADNFRWGVDTEWAFARDLPFMV